MEEFSTKFQRTAKIIHEGIAQGLHPGAQIYVSVNGETMADVGLGEARDGVPMDRESILLWYSCGKPVTAVAIGILWDRGVLDLDDLACLHIPEFGKKGKEAITIRHLLTHTAGIRWADYTPDMPWDQIIARICEAPLEPRWVVGKTAAYHAFTSWYILAEIVRRCDPQHRDLETFLRGNLFERLGETDCHLTLTSDQYRAYGDRIGVIKNTGPSQPRSWPLDSEQYCGLAVPAAGLRGPVRGLGKFYEMLLGRGMTRNNQRILQHQTVDAMTARWRTGVYDQTFKHIVDWGQGFLINSAQYGDEKLLYGYGPYASPRTFGHGGNQASTAFADPERRLVVAVIFNGTPGEVAHQKRMRATIMGIYEDLGLPDAAKI